MLEECAMKILLLTPPMTQLNTPYPATAYLTGFLRQMGYDTVQADPAIELVLRLFSKSGLQKILSELKGGAKPPRKRVHDTSVHPSVVFFLTHQKRYLETVDPAIRFLQGKDP